MRAPMGGNTAALQQEIGSLKETVTGLERERDFYFSKLRDIELLIQRAVEVDPEIEKDNDGLVKQIQNILYSTEVSRSSPATPTPTDSSPSRRASKFQQRPKLRTILRPSECFS